MRNTRLILAVMLLLLVLLISTTGWLFWERTSIVNNNATMTAEFDTLKDQITKADEVQDTNRQLQDQVEDLQQQLRDAQSGEANPLPVPEPTPEGSIEPTPEVGTEPTPTIGGATPPDEVLAIMNTIEQQVIQIRGLPEERPVERRFMTRPELREYIEAEMAEENEPEELENSQLELWLLGLAPADLDLETLFIELQTEQIAGFYDPEIDTFYLIGDTPELPPIDQITYAHEFAHNLQDQLVDLNAGLTVDEFDNDRALAYRALVEGDASLAMQYWTQQYLLQNMTPEELQQLLSELQETEQSSSVLNTAPAIIRESLTFPYETGLFFVQALYDQGGWELVNQALQDPPTSTEQIIHPEKYYNTPREGANLPNLFDMSGALDGGWTTATTNTLGEFDLQVLLEEIATNASSRETQAGAAGIDGIRYALYKQTAAEGVLLQMTLQWDTATDGDEFLQVYRSGLTADSDIWNRDGISIGITGEGQQFTIFYSPDAATVRAALAVHP